MITEPSPDHNTYDSSKPHAVTSIENTARLMDMSRLDTEYNGFGKIERIHNDETNRSLDFLYGPDEERYCSIQRDSAGSVERETVYLDGLDIVVDGQGNKEWFYYVDDHVITKKTGSGTFSHYFTFTDQVGSILKVVDANETERFSATYDPWGRQTVTLNEIGLIRGFTGHEMLTEYDLINMNGRLYDPLLGRFLSTDNFVQEPGSTQSFNRYSYCLNNPLKYNDPSGEWFGIDDLIVAGAGFIFGYVSNGISSGNWGWSSLMSGVSTAAMSWLGYNTAGMATGTINAATWNSITNLGLNTAINMMLPPINIPMGNFTLTMSPAFGFGEGGLNSGLNIGIVYSDDDFHFGLNAGVGSTYIGWFAEVGYRNVTAGYGLTYYKGTTIGDYAIGKQTVGTGKISWGDFSLTVSNDLFSEKKQDRWRTSAVEVGIGDFLIGTSVFTNNGKEESPYIGDKKYSSVEDPIVGKHLYKDLDGNTYGSWNNGKVFSAPFWIGHRNGCQVFRAGISSKVVQSLTQNFVHKWMRTPYFLNYNNFKSGAFSYYGYYNPLTLWNN